MRRINVMLKHKKSLLILSLSFVLFSCGKKVSALGLTPGIYYFESVEGLLPDGWKFDETSYFEFKDPTKDNPTFNYKTDMKPGQWQMSRYEPDAPSGEQFNHNYIIEWYNTPFNDLPPLERGSYKYDLNNESYIQFFSTDKDIRKTWGEYCDLPFDCALSYIDKNDTSKRRFALVMPFNTNLVKQNDKFTRISFSM